jgi:hypothetical protein
LEHNAHDVVVWRDKPLAKECRRLARELLEAYQRGDIPTAHFCESLKSETRPNAKIELVKTRTISVSPLHHTVVARQLFGGLKAWLLGNPIESGICIGVNALGLDWTLLQRRIFRHNNIICGDFSNWDGSIRPFFAMHCFLPVAQWFYSGDYWNSARHTFTEALTYNTSSAPTFHFGTAQGNPSGWALTSEYNSIIHLCLLYAWIHDALQDAPHLLLPQNLDKNVELQVYGDDHILSVSDEYARYLNMYSLRDFVEPLGFGYTDVVADKSGVFRPFIPKAEAEFLSRRFVSHSSGFCLAPRGIDAIHEQLNYCRRNATTLDIQAGVLAACYEMWMHGPEEYDKFVRKLEPVLDKKRLLFPLPDFKTLESIWLGHHRACR